MKKVKENIILVIIDGFGIRAEKNKNAVKHANMPNYQKILKNYPHTELKAAQKDVGLPFHVMGNSEVGHMNLGAGRIVIQDLTRINNDIRSHKIFQNKVLKKAMDTVKKNDKKLHLIGLVSDAGVHSHIRHLLGLVEMAKNRGLKKVYIHAFTDGRDTNVHDAAHYIRRVQRFCKSRGVGKIATIIGRYFAMDRDHRWSRTKRAYDLLTHGAGQHYSTALKALKENYKYKFTDEFLRPSVIDEKGLIENGDGVIFFNFRTDRPRQLTEALTSTRFKHFKNHVRIKNFVCMTQYDKRFKLSVAYPPITVKNTLGEVYSRLKKRQLRIAETEKYAHVTFFFNNGVERPYRREDRIIIPSPKVATYDLAPEMSARKITARVVSEMKKRKYDLIVMNLANPDMVGHTGNFYATIKGLEVVDECLGKILLTAKKSNYLLLITADHGNCENMEGSHRTSHTTNPVPFVICTDRKDIKLKQIIHPNIGMVAPTILKLKGYKIPREMEKPLV